MSYHLQLLEGYQRRKQLFLAPAKLLEAAAEYVKWCEETPLLEEVINHYKGQVIRTNVAKVRPLTMKGLGNFIGLSPAQIKKYAERGEDWAEVVELIEQVIYTQKFENAAAGLLNSTIISRDLGLAEKQELSAPDGPIEQVVVYGLPDNGRS